MPRLSDKEEYLRNYPAIKKWLNFCPYCQTEGYKPELPKNIHPGLLAQNIRKYWNVSELNDDGICLICASLVTK